MMEGIIGSLWYVMLITGHGQYIIIPKDYPSEQACKAAARKMENLSPEASPFLTFDSCIEVPRW